jgi:rhamnose transport system permease protein
MLVLLLLAVNVMNSQLSDNYLSFNGIMSASMVFIEKGFLVLGMAFVILIAEIDISVASTVALSATIMGVVYAKGEGVPMPVAMLTCLAVATLCGLLNGILVAKFREIAAMIITLSTMSLYRGISWIILQDQSSSGFPDWYYYIASGTLFQIGEYRIPFVIVLFIAFAVVFYIILHKTTFGVKLYAIGNNAAAAEYSGIDVQKTRIAVFTILGFLSGVTAIILSSRIASVRPNVAQGYELDIIAMTVLGGVRTDGGTGKIISVCLSVFLIGLIRYGMGIINIRTEVVLIIVGSLLIFSLLLPNIAQKFRKNSAGISSNL